MTFVQVEFLAFLVMVWVAYWSAPSRVWQNRVLLVASFVFYGWIHPWFVLLLLGSATLDFHTARWMVGAPRYRSWFLALTLIGDLGLLGIFKYFDFFVGNLGALLVTLGVPVHLGTLGLILPVGISFYTFQTLGYAVDVYRGELRPRERFDDYLVFVSFFPQLVAGPIERAGRLLPQVEARRSFSWLAMRSGATLAAWGAAKKVVVADSIAPYVDRVFTLTDPAPVVLWAAVFAFMVQIYADFSGYTDIARGVARTLGFELVRNFDRPWASASTPEFWRRWHISLSTWIRDYVLAPLLGDPAQIGIPRFLVAVGTTMVLVGLWHGAAWNFVAFGVFQAVVITLYVAWGRYGPGWRSRPLAIAIHLLLVAPVASLIFREPDPLRVPALLAQLPWAGSADDRVVAGMVLALVAVGSAILGAGEWLREEVWPKVASHDWRLPAEVTLWCLATAAVWVFSRDSQLDFVYFQF